jgi:signal transduction histidine kinase
VAIARHRCWLAAALAVSVWLQLLGAAHADPADTVAGPGPMTFAHAPITAEAAPDGQPDVSGLTFFPDPRPAPNFGFSPDRWWARTTVPQTSGGRLLFLNLDAPVADRLAAYLRCDGERWLPLERVSGRKTLFSLGPGRPGCDVLLMQESHSGIQFNLGWVSASALANPDTSMLIGVAIGTSLTMAALVFILWLTARRRELPYFIAYQLAACVVILNVWAPAPERPWFGGRWLSDFIGVAALNIWVLGYLGFLRRTLRFDATHPRLDRAMDLLLVMFAVIMFCRALGLLITGPLTVGILLLSTICYWVVVVLQWNVDRRRSIRQLTGFSPSVAGSAIFFLMLAGYARLEDLRALFLLGQIASTLALGFWIAQTFKQDRDAVEAKLVRTVRALEENRAELERYQGDLETMVAARTGELQRALSSEREIVAQQRDFTAMIGHEFRTPLAVIDGQARRIGNAGGAEADLLRRAREIRDAVRDMIGLMNGLLFHARQEMGATEYRFETLEMRDLLRQAIDAALPPARMADLRISCQAGILVRADRSLLATALSNIIGNAGKYSAAGTPIGIRADASAEAVAIQVTDQGSGIAPGDIVTVFARFQRGSNVFSTPGSGLGLFFARRIAEGHGGALEVTSVLGEGSCFTMRLPAAARSGLPATTERGAP